MAKLSRKDRYKDLRDSIQIDQGDHNDQPKIETNVGSDLSKKSPTQQHVLPQTHSVKDDLFDEVSVDNQNSSYAHLEEKQIEILNGISNSSHDIERRNSHLMTMEQKQDDGGTTRNLFSSDLSSVVQNTNVKQPSLKNQESKIDLFADMPVRTAQKPTPTKNSRSAQFREILETDDLLDPKVNVPSQEKKTIQKDQPQQKLSRTKSPEDLAQEQYFASKKPRRQSRQIVHDSSQDKPASKAALIFMILCCIILSVLIGLTIFWMSKLRIF